MRLAGRTAGATSHVVSMEGDVDRPELELDPAPLRDERAEPAGERDTTRVDADEHDLVEVVVVLDDLVCDPRERACDAFAVEQHAGRGAARGGSFQTFSFPASLNRVKGSARV